MEEIQSTEILDREILEDARKKAWRILKTADETVQTKITEWEKKTVAALDELNQKHARQCKIAELEIMARLPMDKRRAEADKIENLLRSAVEEWYAGLSRGQVLDLLKRELAKRLAFCDDFAVAADKRLVFRSLTRKEVETIVRAVLPAAVCVIEEAPAVNTYPEIILETKHMRITASVQRTVEYFLHVKRAELLESLLGREEGLC